MDELDKVIKEIEREAEDKAWEAKKKAYPNMFKGSKHYELEKFWPNFWAVFWLFWPLWLILAWKGLAWVLA